MNPGNLGHSTLPSILNLSWIFIGRTDAEAETPKLWPPDVKSWLIRKDRDAGKDWGQEEKGTTGDEMIGWHHRLSGLEFEQAPGDAEGQGGPECCSPRGRKESDTTEWLNNFTLRVKIKKKCQQILNSITGWKCQDFFFFFFFF